MNKRQYETIKLQINIEKEKIMTEISDLLIEKRAIEKKKQYEIHVFQSRSKVMSPNRSISAGLLMFHTFSPEKFEEFNRRIELITGFIKKNEVMLEQVKEKERTIDGLFQEQLYKEEKENEKQEERTLLDLKMCIGNG
ncbi:hypothetical protein ACFDTO_15515 [Microbacteriaceae bacterium 4G12]